MTIYDTLGWLGVGLGLQVLGWLIAPKPKESDMGVSPPIPVVYGTMKIEQSKAYFDPDSGVRMRKKDWEPFEISSLPPVRHSCPGCGAPRLGSCDYCGAP